MDNLNKALNCNKSVFIQACAGAGKTFALTKRYAAILDYFAGEAAKGVPLDRIDHKKILVITFTKKAASEMTRRIYKDVNLLLSGREIKGMEGRDFCPVLRRNDKSVQGFTNNLKLTFSQNSISTIDSFCAGILREFAYRINLDPQFIAQNESESKKLLDESMEIWLRLNITENPHIFDNLLQEMSVNQIRQAIKTQYNNREILDDYTSHFSSMTDEKIWEDWLIRYTPSGEIENLVVCFEALWKNAQFLCQDKQDPLYLALETMYNELQMLDRQNPLEFRAIFLSEVIRKSVFVTSQGTYRKNKIGSAGKWTDNKDQADAWFRLLQETVSIEDLMHTPGFSDQKIIPLLRELISIFKEFDSYYFDIRKQRNVLDFSDIIIETHRLLTENRDIREQLGKRYRHIMVDEFQDTNPMRWEIIQKIFESTKDAKLFIVGDRKQSIYRFNNADVTVMNTAEKLIRDLGGEILDFNDNYRSSEMFINEGINPLIARILPAKGNEKEAYEADFEPTRHKINKEPIRPALEMHWCALPEEKGDDNISAMHAAKQIKRLLKKYDGSAIDEAGKPLIGVLFQKFTNIADYLQAFRRLDIPISIIGGKGFYETPAVKDIFHFLSVLDNPYDDHALIGLLRSPFLALSDPEIHLLSRRDKGTPLFEAMNEHVELHESKSLLLDWIDASGKMPLAELLGKILDSADRELGYVSELLPKQQLANLDKAINIIRGRQRNGSSLREIREFFAYQMAQNTNEAQAVYPDAVKVQLLTIHKAKGLEFPIVVIPEMNSRGNVSKNSIRFGRTGHRSEIALSLTDQDKPGLLLRLKEIVNREEEAEDKRLFYVALTRAIYKVCLLGEGDKAIANTWWDKYVLLPFGLEGKEGRDPENWTDIKIEKTSYDNVAMDQDAKNHESIDWQEIPDDEDPGLYLYRSPHDLMGNEKNADSNDGKTNIGMALGSLYHVCIERKWYDLDMYQEEITEYIQTHFPQEDEKTLLGKIGQLLQITHDHEIFSLLNDSSIKRFHELPIKAWLKRKRDIVQVNGTLDLLYHHAGKWVVVDFKTDSTVRSLDRYKQQIRSYQWMLKQAYGIEASGKIFFVSLNEIINVTWDDDYFDDLPLGQGFIPELPENSLDIGLISDKISSGKHLIICSSSHHEEQIFLALVKAGRMRPDIQITTLEKWIKSSYIQSTSQDRLRLWAQRMDGNMKTGTADLLSKAIIDHELKKGELHSEFIPVYQKILHDTHYRSAILPYMNRDVDAERILLIDLPPLAPMQKELIDKIRVQKECIDCSLSPGENNTAFQYIEAFSPREEVLAVARHMKESGMADKNILIAVSSMEKYAPHLQRLFPHLGLEVRFTGPRSLLEFPLTELLLNVIRISTLNHPEWSDLAPILLHPLMNPNDHLLDYDKKLRSKPWEERVLPGEASNFLDLYVSSDSSQTLKLIEKFIADYKFKSVNESLCKKIIDMLTGILIDLETIFGKYQLSALYHEMKTRIQNESIPGKDQKNGIPVVGFLDSLGSMPDRLYVLGMVEGDIPRPENENPCLIRKEKFSLELNHHFMSYWRSLGSRVIFSSCLHTEDGNEQNRSTFLEDLNLIVQDTGISGKRSSLLNYESRHIRDPYNSLARRHNEIISGIRREYSGFINEKETVYYLPVTAVDTLLACPMRFYFDRILNISPADEDENKYWIMKKGSVIHKVMEYFTNDGGFLLPLEDQVRLIKKNINKVFEEEKIDWTDTFHIDHFRHYVRELSPDSEMNALVKILKDNKKEFGDYQDVISEKGFEDYQLNYDSVKVFLSGRIDKIMLNEPEKKMIAGDYKTGTIKTHRLKSMLLSQLYLYLQKCKEDYPEYEHLAVYEQIKDARNTKIIQFAEAGTSFIQKGSRKGNGFVIAEFKDHLSELFTQISLGNYYITTKIYKEACEYCPHSGLCRRDSRLKIKEN